VANGGENIVRTTSFSGTPLSSIPIAGTADSVRTKIVAMAAIVATFALKSVFLRFISF